MKNASKKQNLRWLQQISEEGINVPTLEKIPKLLAEAVWLWDAFEILSEKRIRNEIGPQPISMSDIRAYADYVEIADEVDREDFLHLITALDRVFISEVMKRKTERDERNKRRQQRRGRGSSRLPRRR